MGLYLAGANATRLAARFGVHRTTVASHVQRAGHRMRGQSMTAAEVDTAAALYVGGWSTARIGDELGFDGSTVWRALRRHGLSLRTPHQA